MFFRIFLISILFLTFSVKSNAANIDIHFEILGFDVFAFDTDDDIVFSHNTSTAKTSASIDRTNVLRDSDEGAAASASSSVIGTDGSFARSDAFGGPSPASGGIDLSVSNFGFASAEFKHQFLVGIERGPALGTGGYEEIDVGVSWDIAVEIRISDVDIETFEDLTVYVQGVSDTVSGSNTLNGWAILASDLDDEGDFYLSETLTFFGAGDTLVLQHLSGAPSSGDAVAFDGRFLMLADTGVAGTQIVPLPAAAWFFLSSLAGLSFIARRK